VCSNAVSPIFSLTGKELMNTKAKKGLGVAKKIKYYESIEN
jgi:hypothetical protein